MSSSSLGRAAMVTLTVVLSLHALAVAALDTTVNFTVDANAAGLTLTQGTSTVAIDEGGGNPVFDLVDPATVSGSIPTITVDDTRGVPLGAWSVDVVATDWTSGGNTVDASNGRVYFDVADVAALTTALGGLLNGMVLTGCECTGGGSDLGTAYTLVQGTTTTGTGDVQISPTVEVTIPAATPVGTYGSTVTFTVS